MDIFCIWRHIYEVYLVAACYQMMCDKFSKLYNCSLRSQALNKAFHKSPQALIQKYIMVAGWLRIQVGSFIHVLLTLSQEQNLKWGRGVESVGLSCIVCKLYSVCSCLGIWGHAPGKISKIFYPETAVLMENYEAVKLMVGG